MNNRHVFFTTLNSFFDKIYVITLRRATDRQAHIQEELDGLHYEFFFGKDKQEFSVEELAAKGIYDEALARKHHRYGKPMPPGMIGCSWSHAEVYKTIAQQGHQRTLILEDDVVIDDGHTTLLPGIFNELPSDWQLLYFGFAEKETVPPLAFLKKGIYHLQRAFGRLNYTHTTIRNLYPKRVGSHVWKAGYHDCTHAYGLTLSGAQTLLKMQTPISYFPDNLLAQAATDEQVKAYIILPKLINQQYQVGGGSASYIHQ